jgi:hypothetical protein
LMFLCWRACTESVWPLSRVSVSIPSGDRREVGGARSGPCRGVIRRRYRIIQLEGRTRAEH